MGNDASVLASSASSGSIGPQALRRLAPARYVLPLREGGSVPALIEADDGRLYVVKLRGAGQGPRALVAEVIAGELGRRLGLAVPELVLIDLDPVLARSERDAEIQDLLRASAGINLGMAHVDGAVTFDPAAGVQPSPSVAARVVALDAFTTNVDRTPRNPNLLWWRDRLVPIDHGAALYWQHDWDGSLERARPARPFPMIRDHVLLPRAPGDPTDHGNDHGHDDLAAAGVALAAAATDDVVRAIVDLVPDDWLAPLPAATTPAAQRAAYAAWLTQRRAALPALMEEAARARTPRV